MTSKSSPSTVVNELLAYATFYRTRHESNDNVELKRIISQFYSYSELLEAEAVLRSTFANRRQPNDPSDTFSSSSSLFGMRLFSLNPSQIKVGDIMHELDILDRQGVLNGTSFVAKNLDRLPNGSPSNANSVYSRQFKGTDVRFTDATTAFQCHLAEADAKVDEVLSLNNPLANVKISDDESGVDASPVIKAVADMNRKLIDGMRDLAAQVQQTNESLRALSAGLVNGPHSTECDTLPRNTTPWTRDNSENAVIITGLQDEPGELINCRSHVESLLLFVAGRKVDVREMSRMFGDYNPGRVRPVLVRLRWANDRELLLARRNILNQPHSIFGKIRIHLGGVSELSRRMSTMKCLRRKAELDGASALVDDDAGTLTINGIRVFTLQFGFAEEWHARAGTTSSCFKPLYSAEDTCSTDNDGLLTDAIRMQCITAMAEYEDKSLEELRLEDYVLNFKAPVRTTLMRFGTFHEPLVSSTVSSCSGFAEENEPVNYLRKKMCSICKSTKNASQKSEETEMKHARVPPYSSH